MSENNSLDGAFGRVFSELQAARDGVRLQAHLFSLETRERWSELETSVEALEHRLHQEGENVSLIAQAGLSDLTHKVTEFITRHLARGSTLETSARAIMSASPRTCRPEDRLDVPVQIMWEADCGVVPVVNPEGRAVGVITDRDVCMSTYMQGKDLGALSVGSAMSQMLYTCEPSTPVWRILELMREAQVHRLLVIGETGDLQGIVALADVARLKVMDEMAACALLARTVSALSEARVQSPTAQ